MKENTHPEYRDVLFIDSATETKFLIGSTLKTKEKGTFEGKEYPAVRVSISSASHPFFTGANQFIDSEGRVDKFQKKYAKKKEAAKAAAPAPEEKKKRVKKAK